MCSVRDVRVFFWQAKTLGVVFSIDVAQRHKAAAGRRCGQPGVTDFNYAADNLGRVH